MKLSRRVVAGYLAFFTNGMLAVITANLMNYFIKDNGFTYHMVSICLALQSFGNVMMVAVSGSVIKIIRKNNVLKLFPLLFIAGCIGIITSKNYYVICVGMLITGIGWGLCNNSIHLLMKESSNCKSAINILHMSYALGSFLGPFMMAEFLDFGIGWKSSLMVIIILSVYITLIFTVDHKNKMPENREVRQTMKGLFKEHSFYRCILLYFCYVGIEGAINTWLVNYLSSVGLMNFSMAQKMLSLFWIIIIVARLVDGYILKYIPLRSMMLIQAIGALFFMALIVLHINTIITVLAIIGMAIFIGGISPCNALNASNYISGNGAGSGIIFAGGGIGSMLLPLLVGDVAQMYSITYGMYCIIGMMLIFLVTVIINLLDKKCAQTEYVAE